MMQCLVTSPKLSMSSENMRASDSVCCWPNIPHFHDQTCTVHTQYFQSDSSLSDFTHRSPSFGTPTHLPLPHPPPPAPPFLVTGHCRMCHNEAEILMMSYELLVYICTLASLPIHPMFPGPCRFRLHTQRGGSGTFPHVSDVMGREMVEAWAYRGSEQQEELRFKARAHKYGVGGDRLTHRALNVE